MSYDLTAELDLQKPVKGSGEQFDQDVFSNNMEKIDDAIVADRARLTVLEAAGGGAPLTLTYFSTFSGLDGATPPPRGSRGTVAAADATGSTYDFEYAVDGADKWWLVSPIVSFDTKAHLDSFVTARSANFRNGTRFWVVADSGREYQWNGTAILPVTLIVQTTSPANPVTGQVWLDNT